MRKLLSLFLWLAPFFSIGQGDSTVEKNNTKKKYADYGDTYKVFYSQKLINSNTVEVLPKGILEFRVAHAFDDLSGSRGGIRPNFFGLENSTDVRIGFQAGLTNKLTAILSRSKGGARPKSPAQLFELGLKYQFMKQQENDPKHPLSITLFVNSAVSSMTADTIPDRETSYTKFTDRTSEIIQLMIARKFGKVSIQLSPTYLAQGYVYNGDDKNLFAIGGAIRIPITSRFIFIADYFHTFRSQQSKDFWAGSTPITPVKFYDALGAGLEILTAGHVFHLNFTNATELIENRFIPNTYRTWSKGQYRWSFTISRNFRIFKDKKNK